MSLRAPTIDVQPAYCFSVEGFQIIDSKTGVTPSFITSITNETIEIYTLNWGHIGTHSLKIAAKVSPSGEIAE